MRALPPHSAAFMPCEPDPYQEVIGSRGQGLRRVFAVAKARLHRVLSYFAPASLHAAHLGVGGSSGSYSRMTWSILAQMDKNSADPQAAAVGTPVPAPPQVLLRDTSTVHNPLAGVTVTFTVDGGGSIANSVVVTGRDGTASVGTWTLGPTPGANHVIATADGALGSPVTFTATGFSPVLYAVNASDDGLSTIDPATGAEAFVGRLGGTNLNLYTTPVAMAVHVRDGVIFVWNNSGDGTSDAATGDLLNVDRCSGLATKINGSPTGQDIGALAFAHDTLYGARDILVGGALSSQLVLVDTSSGLTTPKGSGVGLRLGGMDANAGGTLYGLELTTAATQRLVTIDVHRGRSSAPASAGLRATSFSRSIRRRERCRASTPSPEASLRRDWASLPPAARPERRSGCYAGRLISTNGKAARMSRLFLATDDRRAAFTPHLTAASFLCVRPHTLGILGLGAIGGSVALQAKRAGIATSCSGGCTASCGRTPSSRTWDR